MVSQHPLVGCPILQDNIVHAEEMFFWFYEIPGIQFMKLYDDGREAPVGDETKGSERH